MMERGEWMQCRSGRRVWPQDPRPEDIDIEDIASGLRCARFGYQSEDAYTVAQHSVLVSLEVERIVRNDAGLTFEQPLLRALVEQVFWGLMHDAAEGLLGDVIWPVKRAPELAGYKALEARMMKAIVQRYRMLPEEPEVVKLADIRLLATEKRDIMDYPTEEARSAGRENTAAREQQGAWHSDHIEPLTTRIIAWQPNAARREFLRRFRELEALRT